MTINELEHFIKLQRTVTVAEVQSKFNVKYGEAREAFRTLEKEGKIKFVGGLNFEWCLMDVGEEALARHRKELQERLEKLRDMRVAEEEDDDDDLLDLGELFDDGDDEEEVAAPTPQPARMMVTLESIVNTPAFRKSKAKLAVGLGRDYGGNDVVMDLANLPHLLIAGATGSGKSMILNDIILSLAQKYSPDYVRLLLVDPKFVEFSRYSGLPHALTKESIAQTSDGMAALDYLIAEMESRYVCFREQGVANIDEYNKKATDKLPYLVLIVDELAEYMMLENKRLFEIKINRLAQKCRASGIHMVLATQRPDVSVVTGTVKANVPARIALKTVSRLDSATVLNQFGAEELLGSGDMLFLDCSSVRPQRLQGAYVSNEEIRDAVAAHKKKYPCVFDAEVEAKIFVSKKTSPDDGAKERLVADPLCRRALRFWLEKQNGRASIASIQRNLAIGYNRAGRIMDYCQKMGYVEQLSETDPSIKPVSVRITLADLPRLFPDQED